MTDNIFKKLRLLHKRLYQDKDYLDLAYDRFNKTYDEIKKTWDSFPEKALYDQKWEELENEAEKDLSIEDKRECHKGKWNGLIWRRATALSSLQEGQADIFVHLKDIERSGLKTLEYGQNVEYQTHISTSKKYAGKLHIREIRILNAEPPADE